MNTLVYWRQARTVTASESLDHLCREIAQPFCASTHEPMWGVPSSLPMRVTPRHPDTVSIEHAVIATEVRECIDIMGLPSNITCVVSVVRAEDRSKRITTRLLIDITSDVGHRWVLINLEAAHDKAE